MVLAGLILIGLAQAQSIATKDITVLQQDDYWQITPHYEMALSDAIVEAIRNGIEITFVSEMRLIAEKTGGRTTPCKSSVNALKCIIFP